MRQICSHVAVVEFGWADPKVRPDRKVDALACL